MVEVDDALRALGGVARWKELRGHVSWRALRRARSAGTASHVNGTWSLVGTGRARAAAVEMRGVRSHRAAAEHWGFALPPAHDRRLDVTVPRKAKRANIPDDVLLHFRDYPPTELDEDVTTALTTVVDCLRDLPLRDALSVGDSALRSGLIGRRALERAAAGLRGPGSRRTRDRVALLDARAANAFESSARALLIEAGLLGFRPQVSIRHRGQWIGRVDLADPALRVVVECDGFETHGGRDAFVRDLVRFTWLVSAGWRPLRLTWEQVMFEPEWVLARVRDTVALSPGARTTAQPAQRRLGDAA